MEKKKKNNGRIFYIILAVIACLVIAVYFIFFHRPHSKNDTSAASKAPATTAATEFVITPGDAEDEQLFRKSLIGAWSSYTKDGEAYTYTFDQDGSVRYKKEGENAVDYSYTFKDGLLTIKGGEKDFVYQCSKDAVGMMANLQQGAWKNLFSKTAEKIPGFNGCVYIVDDFMYMGTVCLCRDDRLDGFDLKSIDGDWLGVMGDTIRFDKDGKYTYVNNAEKARGEYVADFDKKTLTITLNGKSTEYDADCWGLNGRVFRIENQYYFKLSK